MYRGSDKYDAVFLVAGKCLVAVWTLAGATVPGVEKTVGQALHSLMVQRMCPQPGHEVSVWPQLPLDQIFLWKML